MTQLYRACLDGIALDSLSDDIILTGISEAAPGIKAQTVDKASGYGSRVERTTRSSIAVTIRFVIAHGDYTHRLDVIDKVRGWCRAGWLTTTLRPGKRLFVQPTAVPAATTLARSAALQLTLTAFEMPWWEDETPTTVTINGNGTGELFVTGTADGAACDVFARNAGAGTVNELTLHVGGSMFGFSGLGLAAGEELRCTHSSDGYLRIMIQGADGEGRSAYHLRQPESDDELVTVCGGPNAVSVEADGTMETRIEVRGRWA